MLRGQKNAYCCHHAPGVKRRDKQRVKNVADRTINASSTSKVYTVLVTWEQNLIVDEPTSLKVDAIMNNTAL